MSEIDIFMLKEIQKLRKENQKMRLLLEQAKEYINSFDCKSDQCELAVEQWLKDYEELK